MSITSFRPFSHGSRIMFWALLLSLLLHLWLLFMPQIDLSLPSAAKSTAIDTDLVSILKVSITEAPVATLAAPQLQQESASPVASSAPAVNTSDVTEGSVASASSQEAPAAAKDVAPPQAAKPALPQKLSQEAKSTLPQEPQPSPPQEVAPEPHPPLKVTVEFALLKGEDGMKVGRVVHTWQISDGHYIITNAMEATGVFALIRPGILAQNSQGRITVNGLEPESFWDQRGQEADMTFNAQFDYQKKIVIYGRGQEITTSPLPPGTQDLLSFVYQFALRAPFTGTMQFSMTNGRKLDSYTYQVVGEEMIETGLGKLRTLHLSKVHQPSDDGVDVWLAADHQYLPVKIRLTNNNGDVLEQVVQGIRGE